MPESYDFGIVDSVDLASSTFVFRSRCVKPGESPRPSRVLTYTAETTFAFYVNRPINDQGASGHQQNVSPAEWASAVPELRPWHITLRGATVASVDQDSGIGTDNPAEGACELGESLVGGWNDRASYVATPTS